MQEKTRHSVIFVPRILAVFLFSFAAIILSVMAFADNPTPPGWALITSPPITASTGFAGATCASPSDCWAVGSDLGHDGHNHTATAHWDGSFWTLVYPPNSDSSEDNTL